MQCLQLFEYRLRSTRQQRLGASGDAQRLAARLASKGISLLLAGNGDPLAVGKLNAPYFDGFGQLLGLRLGWRNDGLHRDNHLPGAMDAPGANHLAQQVGIAIQMGSKNEVPVEAGGQARALCAGAQQEASSRNLG